MADSLARIQWVGFSTIVIREFNRIVRIWGQTVVPPIVTATLYFVIFGSLIGKRVGLVGGYDYMQFIAPGLIMMNVIQTSYANVVSSFFGAKFGKHLEELLVSPLPNWLILLGYVAGGMLRGLLVGSVVTVVALFFTRLAVQHAWTVLSAVLLTSTFLARRFRERAVRQELRSHILVPDVRAHAAHIPGRRLLFDHDASGLGSSRLPRQSDSLHGERLPLRILGLDRCRPVARLRHHDRLGGVHVHGRRHAVE